MENWKCVLFSFSIFNFQFSIIMRDFIQILKRFIPPYKSRLGKNIFYNILSAAFGSVSFVLLVPVLNILFNVTEEVTELVPFELNKESLMTNKTTFFRINHLTICWWFLCTGRIIQNGILLSRLLRDRVHPERCCTRYSSENIPKDIIIASSLLLRRTQGWHHRPYHRWRTGSGELHHELVGNVLPEPHHHPDLPLRNDLHELATNPVRASTIAHHGYINR